MKKVLSTLFVAVAAAYAAPQDKVLHQADPYLNRVVEEAIELGEHSLLEIAVSGASNTLHLDHPTELESSLLSVSQEIFGAPAPAAKAPVHVHDKVVSKKASPSAHIQFDSLLSETENASDLKLIQQKKQEILSDKQADAKLLEEFNKLTSEVETFNHKLNDQSDGSLKSLLEAGAGAEETHAPAAKVLSPEEQMQHELEQELDSEEQSHETFFLQLEQELAVTDNLVQHLEKVMEPFAEDEAMEPTFLEEFEAIEDGDEEQLNSSYLMTAEELSAQLDSLAKME